MSGVREEVCAERPPLQAHQGAPLPPEQPRCSAPCKLSTASGPPTPTLYFVAIIYLPPPGGCDNVTNTPSENLEVLGEGAGVGGRNPEPPSCCLFWKSCSHAHAPHLGWRPAAPPSCLVPLSLPASAAAATGPGPFLSGLPRWAPGQHFIAWEEEMCSFEMSIPRGSHAGRKEMGQKPRAALCWRVALSGMPGSARLPGCWPWVRHAGPGLPDEADLK